MRINAACPACCMDVQHGVWCGVHALGYMTGTDLARPSAQKAVHRKAPSSLLWHVFCSNIFSYLYVLVIMASPVLVAVAHYLRYHISYRYLFVFTLSERTSHQ